MQNVQGYIAILEKGFELAMPQGYKEDLTKHDKQTLTNENAPQVFVWAVRECGT